jgi:quercetin dioxygenase-like cupin family protein
MKEDDMAIESTPNYFTERGQAVSEIEASGLHLAEAELTDERLSMTPHVHEYDVSIYILDGVMVLHEPDTGLIHRLEPGSRTLVPAQTLHAESCPGPFTAVFGVSAEVSELS